MSIPVDAVQPSLFDQAPSEKGQRLMQTLDQINHRLGAGSIRYAAVGLKQDWKTQAAYPSRRYITCWDELPIVQA
jgi:DNA polymerase V